MWQSFPIQCKAKELDLSVRQYRLPQFILKAGLLTQLKLQGVKMEVPFISTFPTLKILSLDFVEFDCNSLQYLISGCIGNKVLNYI